MVDTETRGDKRDSFFLLANVQRENSPECHRIRVRNLSDGGMMGEGSIEVARGDRVEIEMRNIGKRGGTVAWVHNRRFGLAFDTPIDSGLARQPVGGAADSDRTIKPTSSPYAVRSGTAAVNPIRKI